MSKELEALENIKEYIIQSNREIKPLNLSTPSEEIYIVKYCLQEKEKQDKILTKQFIEDIVQLLGLVDTDLPLSNFDGAIREDTPPYIYIYGIIQKLEELKMLCPKN